MACSILVSALAVQAISSEASRWEPHVAGFLQCNISMLLQLPVGMENQTTAETFKELVQQAWQSGAALVRVPSQLLVAFQMTL